MTAGRVGRPHGTDGSFYLERPDDEPLAVGATVLVAGEARRVVRLAGTAARPLVALSGVEDREAATGLRGEPLLVERELGEDEWTAEALLGCRVDGLGTVRRILGGPSCDVLELDDGRLVPFVSDAVRTVDTERGVIEVDLRFLGEAS